MLKAEFITYTLDFKFLAGTSRGSLKTKKSWFLKIWKDSVPEHFGVGEAGPLPGLSIDYNEDKIEKTLQDITNNAFRMDINSDPNLFLPEIGINPIDYPSIVMALETAICDLKNGGERIIYKNSFNEGRKSLPINGLIWMGDKDFMLKQIDKKLAEGFDCIKIKVGALDFKTEIEVLEYLRSKSDAIEIRLDANGAFNEVDVYSKLKQLAVYGIHSIEQPVKQGKWQLMKEVIRESPIKVALDEELISINSGQKKRDLLKELNPDYIILKPSLIGGFSSTAEWIENAVDLGIGWWITSALESNVGLNAICQFTSEYDTNMYQGLGTGSLYENNIPSPLEIKDQKIRYNRGLDWDMSSFV